MPAPRRSTTNESDAEGDTSTFVGQAHPPSQGAINEEPEGYDAASPEHESRKSSGSRGMSAAERRAKNGTMDRNFKFPSPTTEDSPPPLPSTTSAASAEINSSVEDNRKDSMGSTGSTKTPEVPPPDPVEKERRRETEVAGDEEEDVGETEEISLN